MDKKDINKYQLNLYHKNKNNPKSSHYFENRRLQQKKDYHKKNPDAKYYNKNKINNLKIIEGNYTISFK